MRPRAGDRPRLRLDHTVIAVSDPARSDAFYRDVLGAEIRELPRGRRAYRFGEQQLKMSQEVPCEGATARDPNPRP